jgi:hypothetical protein
VVTPGGGKHPRHGAPAERTKHAQSLTTTSEKNPFLRKDLAKALEQQK